MKKFVFLYLLISTFNNLCAQHKQPLNVLFLHYPSGYVAGIGVSLITCSKMLIDHGHSVHFLVIKDSRMEAELVKNKLPFKTVTYDQYQNTRKLSHHLLTMCTDLHVDIIVCNWLDHGIKAVQKITQKTPIKTIFIDHMHFSKSNITAQTVQSLRHIDGGIGVSPDIEQSLQRLNKAKKLYIKYITYIPPFFEEAKFTTFNTQQTRDAFFKENFDITIKPLPIVCMIANMYKDQTKNHPLLLMAIKKLIDEKKKPLQVMLAGDGSQKQQLQELCVELGIKEYVHFLGFTRQTPELLFHSDFHVLSSQQEAFGIVHLEAALMKKPSIGATNTGATTTIKDGKTGLLFKNNDLDDLVQKIELLIDNKELRETLGNNAYFFAQAQFSNRESYMKLEQFFYTITQG